MKRHLWDSFLYSLLFMLTFLDITGIHAKDDFYSEAIDLQPTQPQLTLRCYEFCGVYVDIIFEGEKQPTWTDLKTSLQLHYNNFKDVLLVNRKSEAIQSSEDAIPEIYFKKVKDDAYILYFYFGDPFKDYVNDLYTMWNYLQKNKVENFR